MEFQLDEDQAALVAAVQDVLRDHEQLPQSERLSYAYFDSALQQLLADGGFLEAGRSMGALAAALVVQEASRNISVVETGMSALVMPQLLPDEIPAGPIALVNGAQPNKAFRNLTIAKLAVIDQGDDVALLELRPGDVEAVPSIFAYPYGRLTAAADVRRARVLPGQGKALRQWSRVALANEFAGAADSAVAFVVDYVKQRHVFGRPIGALQAIQHRLAQCHIIVQGVRYLALRAAWSGTELDANLAASHAQQNTQKLIFDLHQFNGAMGVTNENALHFWSYRMRALQSEAGGAHEAAIGVAENLWGAP